MRLAFICGAGMVSGKELQTFSIMVGMKARGHEVSCLMSSWGSAEFEDMLAAADIPYERVRIGFISKTLTWPAIRMTLHQAIYMPSLWDRYRRFLRAFEPDVVVHTNFHHVFLLLPVLGTAKQVFHVHDFSPPGRFMTHLFSKFNTRLDLFIGVSNFICDSLPALGVDKRKIRLIYNGIVPPMSVSRARSGSIRVGIVGQVSPWKGHEVLVKALAEVSDKSTRLFIIGDGDPDFVARLKSTAGELGLVDRVFFKGRITGIESIYRDLDLVCVPSIMPESFGMTAAEPGFFGIPVICSSVGALPEVVLDNQTGLVVSPGDVVALSRAIDRIVNNESERERLGQTAKAFVNENFSVGTTVSKFEDVLSSLVTAWGST